jgi:hypothetical protein
VLLFVLELLLSGESTPAARRKLQSRGHESTPVDKN